MVDKTINIHASKISGGIATGAGSTAFGENARVTYGADLAATYKARLLEIVDAAASDMGRLNLEHRREVQAAIDLIKAEIKRKSPETNRVEKSLISIKSILEGTVGSLIASFLVGG